MKGTGSAKSKRISLQRRCFLLKKIFYCFFKFPIHLYLRTPSSSCLCCNGEIRQLYMNHLEISASELASAQAAIRGVLWKKVVLKNFAKFTGKHLCHSLFLIKQTVACTLCSFIKKEALAQVFSCESWEIFKNTFFTEHLRATTLHLHWHSNI